jgi:hypothetical protein
MTSPKGISVHGGGVRVASSQGRPSVPRASQCKSSKFLNLALYIIKTFPKVMIDSFYYLPSNTMVITAGLSICVFLIEITVFLVHSALCLIAYYSYGLKLKGVGRSFSVFQY